MTSRALYNISELTTNDPEAGPGPCGRLSDAAIVFDEGRVVWIGPSQRTPAVDEAIDVEGRAVLPGFVDSHTHLVFAGDRLGEFEARRSGRPYGPEGIMTTVERTRSATRAQLESAAAERLNELLVGGSTTVEIKSGYDLTVDGERRLLEVAASLTAETTFLGAHVVPPAYAHRRDEYVSLVAGEMLDACAPLARWADVFCDRGAFTVGEARFILEAARARGLGLRLHGNQIDDTGGVELAVELDAASVDHCSHVNDDDVALLARSHTVATLLPGAEFCTGAAYPSGRRLVDAGVTVALATDCNPGTSYVTSMSFVIALAVRESGLSPDEAIHAATRGGALALRRDDLGRLVVGGPADAVVLRRTRAAELAYRPGGEPVRRVYRAGEPVGQGEGS